MVSERQKEEHNKVKVLIKKSFELAMHNNAEALALARKALGIARRRKDASLELHSILAFKNAIQYCNKPQNIALYDKRLLQLRDSLKSKSDIAFVYATVGLTCMNEAKHQEALEYLFKAKCLAEEIDDTVNKREVLLNISTLLLQTDNYVSALRYAFEGLSIAGDRLIGHYYGTVGTAYLRLYDFDKALYYYSESLVVMKKHRDHHGTAITLTNTAACYHHKYDFDKALECIQKALKLLKKLGLEHLAYVPNLELAALYVEMGDYATALRTAKKAYRLALNSGPELNIFDARVSIGTILHKSGQYKEALKSLLEVLEALQKTKFYELTGEVHRMLSQVYAKLGFHKEAYQAKKEYEKIRSDVRGEKQLQALQSFETKELLGRLEYEQEVIRTRALQAELDIREKEQQLEEQTKRLKKSVETLTQVEQSLQPYLRDGTGAAKELALSVYESLYRTTRTSSGQVNVPVLAFDAQYEDYIRRLFTAHPELTPTEIKVCLLIKLHYPNKSISDLLNISVLTVKTHRARIRKKMELHPQQDLLHVLTVV